MFFSTLFASLSTPVTVASLLASFIIGSFPTGKWIGKLFFSQELESKGSGNIGATNAVRVLGKKAGIFVFLIDGAKGFIPAIGAQILFGAGDLPSLYLSSFMGFAAVLGHCIGPMNGFRGGKGVSTSVGALSVFVPMISFFVPGALIFLILYRSFKAVSAAVLWTFFILSVMAIVLPISQPGQWLTIALTLLIFIRHRSNLERLLLNAENKF